MKHPNRRHREYLRRVCNYVMRARRREQAAVSWLRSQFTDLASAKRFAYYWATELEQQTPWGGCSMRCMAANISDILEGRQSFNSYWYIDTYYGPEIYWAMCGSFGDDAEEEELLLAFNINPDKLSYNTVELDNSEIRHDCK